MLIMLTNDDGRVHVGFAAADLVNRLHSGSRAPEATDQDFMREMANRVVFSTGMPVRYDTAEHFIDDLIRAEVIRVAAPGERLIRWA